MLNHANIVRVFDAGLIKGKPFIRMELLEGKNLSEFLRDHGTMPLVKASTLVRKILEALSHAHGDARVCHRDLKPSNVMVAPGERVKVVDFGMGAFVEQELVSRLTRTGEHLVGGYFSAPELVQNPKVVDARADIYSVGAIWYNVITGRPPAGTDLVEQLKAIPNMTDRYRLAVSKALAAVEKRFQSAADMLAEVQVIEKKWSTEGFIRIALKGVVVDQTWRRTRWAFGSVQVMALCPVAECCGTMRRAPAPTIHTKCHRLDATCAAGDSWVGGRGDDAGDAGKAT